MTEYIVSILKTFVDIEKCTCLKLGKGFYLSDLLEVSWRLIVSISIDNNIPKIGDSFSVLVCQTFYDSKSVLPCYTALWNNEKTNMNSLRIAKVKSDTSKVISEEEIKDYENYVQNEYLISHKEQILPVYAIILRRIEYLIIWIDNNFDKSNPNNYYNFDE